jgi:hypothetical protein
MADTGIAKARNLMKAHEIPLAEWRFRAHADRRHALRGRCADAGARPPAIMARHRYSKSGNGKLTLS